ncbi:MAG TPA: CoA-binding protein [Candidatus Dormibacteraeota bacterium]|nr:CoA-binding protein [Candidatus Dormibacteraeota bacterium]
MILRAQHTVLVQGITGKQATFWTERMRASGTQIVAGSSPGKGGTTHLGVPVYNSARDAARSHQIDFSVLFTPPYATKDAVTDALDAGISNIVVLSEHIPVHDVMWFLADARDRDARVFGPNTAGLVTPGEASLGIMPSLSTTIFAPGSIGVISRSGSLGTLVCLNLTRDGFGQSAFLGIGGDPFIGTTTRDALMMLDRDSHTKAIVLIGELGGSMEEEAAEYAASMDKPIAAFIAGRTAPPGRKMGHAGAIVDGSRGSGDSKVRALAAAGVSVCETPSGIVPALRELLVNAM